MSQYDRDMDSRAFRRGLGTAFCNPWRLHSLSRYRHGIREGVAGKKRLSAVIISQLGKMCDQLQFVDGLCLEGIGETSQLAAGRRVSSHLLASPGSDVPCALSLSAPISKDVVHFSLTFWAASCQVGNVRVGSFLFYGASLRVVSTLLFSSSHCISKESLFLFEHYFVPFINLVISFATLRHFTLHLHFLHPIVCEKLHKHFHPVY